MKKLVLIDGHAILHRAYHALPKTLTSKKGNPINAVYGFTSMILKVISDLEPSHIAVCFDRKEPTFRKKAFEDYQAHRPEMDKELEGQIDLVRKVVESFGIPIYEKAGYEADDVIGTLSLHATKNGFDEVDIVTGDRDILQLVNNKVRVFLPIKGMSVGKLYGASDVIDKMKVNPAQIVDYKGLVGDPSDNYPGVKGIGPKTAESLLERYGSLEEIYKNLDELEGSVKTKLEKSKKDAELSYKLAKIVTDVEIDADFEDMNDWSIGKQETIDLFKQIGFKTLTKRVQEMGKEMVEKQQGALF